MKENLKSFYSNNVNSLAAEILSLKKKNHFFIISELLTFVAAVVAFVFFCIEDMSSLIFVLMLIMLAAYTVLRRKDLKNSERIDSLVNKRRVYEKELLYQKNDFSVFDDGSRYIDSAHPFTFDMDVFGKNSLFNRICRTVTAGGSDRLAGNLQHLSGNKEQIDDTRKSIEELSADEKWRTTFMSMGQAGVIDTQSIVRVLHDVSSMKISSFAKSTPALVMALIVLVGFYFTILLSIFTDMSSNVPLSWGCTQFFIILLLSSKSLHNISKAVNSLHKQLKSYIQLIRLLSLSQFKSKSLTNIKAKLFAEKSDSLDSFEQLSDILDGLDRRGNLLGLIIFNILGLSDFFLVRKFLKWQNLYLDKIEDWVDIISEMDALVSMATFKYNEPCTCSAEIVESDKIIYNAKGLYHPFIGESAVKNDFSMSDGNYYIITGANMAGKSTFLRSIGINYILALNGMPVFADKYTVSLFSLFSSMRTTDDVTRGISYFNAELLRLKQLIENCKKSEHTLIILDEILKGTNSLDKLNGSRLFLQEISKLPVTGVIATHDLELSKMEEEYPERFHNYCFEIKLEDKITYSYKITKGVARNQNATYLLKNIISSI